MEEEGMFSSAEESSQPSGGHPEVHGTSVDICSPVPETQDEKAVSPAGAEDTVLIRGPVTLKRGWRRKKHQVFLYSNVLLVSNSKYKKTIDVKYEIPLSSLWMADCGTETQGAGDTCAKRSFLLGWPMVNFVATFDSSVVKERWYSFLQRYINLAKEEDHTQSILIQVFTADIKNCACSIIITVTNLDTVNDVVNVSLPMLGLTGSEKDYQLWVSSGKKEVPQPLIGHENPYAIQTSYLRAVRLPPEPGKSTFPSGLQESVLEELQSEVHGCFILKPRLQARAQRRTDWLRNLLFRWGIIRSQDDPPPEPAAAAPLSGPACAASLMALSEDDNLASPLSVGLMLFCTLLRTRRLRVSCPPPILFPSGETICQPLPLAQMLCYYYFQEEQSHLDLAESYVKHNSRKYAPICSTGFSKVPHIPAQRPERAVCV